MIWKRPREDCDSKRPQPKRNKDDLLLGSEGEQNDLLTAESLRFTSELGNGSDYKLRCDKSVTRTFAAKEDV